MTKRRTEQGHVYTVELRFSGSRLEPADISKRLALTPSNELGRAGVAAGGRSRRPFWAYNGHGEAGFKPEWESLEEGLRFLIDCLASRKAEVSLLARRFDAVWWCGHFQSSFDGGPTLSAKLLMEIGGYGAALAVDNYFSDE
jgi:hypothetical protein